MVPHLREDFGLFRLDRVLEANVDVVLVEREHAREEGQDLLDFDLSPLTEQGRCRLQTLVIVPVQTLQELEEHVLLGLAVVAILEHQHTLVAVWRNKDWLLGNLVDEGLLFGLGSARLLSLIHI